MQLKSLVERAHQSRGKEVVEAVQRQPWGPGEQHHDDHQIGRDPLATQQGISTCDSIGRDLLDAPGRYMPPRAWLQKQRQNKSIFGKLASWPYYVQLLICCGASWTFGEKILTVTESNLSRLQVNFTKKFSVMEESFFNGGLWDPIWANLLWILNLIFSATSGGFPYPFHHHLGWPRWSRPNL